LCCGDEAAISLSGLEVGSILGTDQRIESFCTARVAKEVVATIAVSLSRRYVSSNRHPTHRVNVALRKRGFGANHHAR